MWRPVEKFRRSKMDSSIIAVRRQISSPRPASRTPAKECPRAQPRARS